MSNEIDTLLKEIEARGLTVAKFAAQAGIPPDRVYQWAKGRGKPKGEDALKIQNWLVKIPGKANDQTGVRLAAHDALFSVVLDEIASLRSLATGGNVTLIKRNVFSDPGAYRFFPGVVSVPASILFTTSRIAVNISASGVPRFSKRSSKDRRAAFVNG